MREHTLTLSIRPDDNDGSGFDVDASCACDGVGAHWIGWASTAERAALDGVAAWRRHMARVTRWAGLLPEVDR